MRGAGRISGVMGLGNDNKGRRVDWERRTRYEVLCWVGLCCIVVLL